VRPLSFFVFAFGSPPHAPAAYDDGVCASDSIELRRPAMLAALILLHGGQQSSSPRGSPFNAAGYNGSFILLIAAFGSPPVFEQQ